MTFFFALANLGLWLVPLALVTGEAVPSQRWLGVAAGLVGIVVLADPLQQDWHAGGILLGHALLLGAALSWALAIFHARRHAWHLTPLQALPWQMLLAALLLTAMAALLEPDGHIERSGNVLLTLAYLGIVGPAGAWAATSVARALPILVSSLGFLGVPVLGLVISTLWMGEQVTPALLAGTALIGFGLVLVMTARQR
jgi:drug/metabolite transporter (DMT)-like permease